MRVNRSLILATVIAAGAAGWVISGQFEDRPATAAVETSVPAEEKPAQQPTRVRVTTSTASDYVATVRASGQTGAARTVEIRAETEGRVAKVGAERGDLLEAGDVIVQLDEADRPARLERAKAQVEFRRLEHDAARKLAAKGFQAETRRAEAFADLQEAQADQASIQLDLERTRIVAPFGAVLEKRPTEVGDYLQVGDPVATLVDLDPLKVIAHIPEQQAPAVSEGMTATARLSTGHEFPAVVSYTAAAADPATRTFRVEAELANPDGRIGEGMTAELIVPLPSLRAHHLSPAAFLLDDQGKVGVMTVGAQDVVQFRHITVLGSDTGGAWVAGLPDTTRVITLGQHLVKPGETVAPVEPTIGAARP